MGFSRSNKGIPLKVARFMRGDCGICHEMIMPGEAYETCVGGSNTGNGYLAHFNCYKPIDAPTWEELPDTTKKALRSKRV